MPFFYIINHHFFKSFKKNLWKTSHLNSPQMELASKVNYANRIYLGWLSTDLTILDVDFWEQCLWWTPTWNLLSSKENVFFQSSCRYFWVNSTLNRLWSQVILGTRIIFKNFRPTFFKKLLRVNVEQSSFNLVLISAVFNNGSLSDNVTILFSLFVESTELTEDLIQGC